MPTVGQALACHALFPHRRAAAVLLLLELTVAQWLVTEVLPA